MASVPYFPLSGHQGQTNSSRHRCPHCNSRLYGAHGISSRAACLVWVCRTAGCGHFSGPLAPTAHRCPCSAVVVPGTGGEFRSSTGLVHICSACTALHPGGAPREILDEHQRITRAQEQCSDYDFHQASSTAPSTVEVTNQKTAARYTVLLGTAPRCSCPDFSRRGRQCKHIFMAQSWLAEQPGQVTPNTPTLEERLADLERRRAEAQRALDARVAAERAAILAECAVDADHTPHDEIALGLQDEERWERFRRERDILWPDA